jgi:hypothetical protein
MDLQHYLHCLHLEPTHLLYGILQSGYPPLLLHRTTRHYVQLDTLVGGRGGEGGAGETGRGGGGGVRREVVSE